MRPGLFALLVCLTLLFTLQAIPRGVPGQTDQIQETKTRLLQAFESVQQADKLGASSEAIDRLSTELNTALMDYNLASQLSLEGNATRSEYYARLSMGNSTSIIAKALVLQNNAESQRANEKLLAYLAAIAASIVSALIVLEYHRIPSLLRKRKLVKTRIKIGG